MVLTLYPLGHPLLGWADLLDNLRALVTARDRLWPVGADPRTVEP